MIPEMIADFLAPISPQEIQFSAAFPFARIIAHSMEEKFQIINALNNERVNGQQLVVS